MTAERSWLPYGRHCIEDDDIAAVAAVLKSNWLTTGPAVSAFEDAFAEAVGAPYAVACANGTAGLHLSCVAMNLGRGDGVVVPTMTFAATASGVRYVGGEVVFADVDADTGLMAPRHLDAAIDRAVTAGIRVKAACAVHLNGQPADMEALRDVAAARGVDLFEDACHAVGTMRRGRGGEAERVGDCRHALLAVFSLHPVKTIAMGEGGVVTTRTPELADRIRCLRNHGIVRDAADFRNAEIGLDGGGAANPWYYEVQELGFNYRASDIHCALGLSQLRKLDRFVKARRTVVQHYDKALARLAPLVRPVGRVANAEPAWHLHVVQIDFEAAGVGRAELMGRLKAQGIGTQVHYIPVHLQPYYRRRYGTPELPGAMAYYQRCLSLPLFATMTKDDVDRVATALADAIDGKATR